MLNTTCTTSSDNKRIIFSVWNGPVSNTVTFSPEEAKAAIADIQREIAVIDHCVKLEAIRAKAEQLIAEEAA